MNKIKQMIKNNISLIFVLVIIIFVAFANKKYLFISSSTDLILFVTFLAILWYTYETRKTRINLLTPVISLELIESPEGGYEFKLKNVGPGSALDIKITDNTVTCRNKAYPSEQNEEKKGEPKFNIPCFLSPGDEKLLTPLQKGEEDRWIIKYPGCIQIEYRNLEDKIHSRKFKITERCKDDRGNTYYQIELLD